MVSPIHHNICVATAVLLLVTLARTACFLPNGTDRNVIYNSSDGRDVYLPCPTSRDGEVSMCCRLGDKSPNTCRPDGLCQAGDHIWRESCTDKTWKPKGCLNLCIDGSMRNEDVILKQCDNGSFCCDQNGSGDQCCDKGQGRWIDGNGSVVDTHPASATSPSPPASSRSSDPGLIVGGVVACVVAAMIVVGGILLVVKYWRHPKNPCPNHPPRGNSDDFATPAPARIIPTPSISTVPTSATPATK